MAKTIRQSSGKPVTIHDQELTRGNGGELPAAMKDRQVVDATRTIPTRVPI